MTGRVVEIADGKVSITTGANDTLQFSIAANNINNLVFQSVTHNGSRLSTPEALNVNANEFVDFTIV